MPHHFMILMTRSLRLKKPLKSEAGDDNGEFEWFESVNSCRLTQSWCNKSTVYVVSCCKFYSLFQSAVAHKSSQPSLHVLMYLLWFHGVFILLYDCHVATLHWTSNFIPVRTRVRNLKPFSIRHKASSSMDKSLTCEQTNIVRNSIGLVK